MKSIIYNVTNDAFLRRAKRMLEAKGFVFPMKTSTFLGLILQYRKKSLQKSCQELVLTYHFSNCHKNATGSDSILVFYLLNWDLLVDIDRLYEKRLNESLGHHRLLFWLQSVVDTERGTKDDFLVRKGFK